MHSLTNGEISVSPLYIQSGHGTVCDLAMCVRTYVHMYIIVSYGEFCEKVWSWH